MDPGQAMRHPDYMVDDHVGWVDWSLLMMVGWEMTAGGWIWMLFWIAALLVMTYLLVRQPGQQPPREDAVTLLRKRFARGEISPAEFKRALDALRNTR